jgi:hypothetical protein
MVRGGVFPLLSVCSCIIRELSVHLLRAIPEEVASPAPHTARGLSAFDPDMTEFLTVKALCQATLSSVGFNPNDDMAKVGQF